MSERDGARGQARSPLVGDSAPMRAIRTRVAALARTRTTLLVTGETGSGKGLVARWLHASSSAAAQPFVHLDCGALAPTMIETELFGHERGSFTGAVERRAGRFERAGRGTVFLDEIAELPAHLQTKLLRVLQDREFERVGGAHTLRMNARVIAATSRNLERWVEDGRFRRDLYYRLAVFELHLPALRERLPDLPLLVRSGVADLAARLGIPPPTVDPGFLEALASHPWPGNVRELLNVLERSLLETNDRCLDARAARRALTRPGLEPPGRVTERVQGETDRRRIVDTLADTGGNVARAARRLGLPRSTLRHRIVRHGLLDMIPRD